MRDNLLQRIYKLKVTIVALVSLGIGILLLALSRYVVDAPSFEWLAFWPISEIGGTLSAAGIFGLAFEYADGKDKEAREDARIRRLLKESAPAFRDAVVEGFAVNSDDLERVATPELLDSIATNVLALRLGDRAFAEEIYADIRDQAVKARERWYDVDVSIRLSSIDERSAFGTPRFAVTVQWEYSTTPSHAVQRFACVSDRDEFHELVTDVPATSTWFMTPRPGFEASSRGAFELLEFRVDGEQKRIRRSERKTGQTYTVDLGEDVVRSGKQIRIQHVYRTITPQSGHRLFIELGAPTRDLSLNLDYTDTDIAHMSVTDLVSSSHKTLISHLPEKTDAKVLSVELPGWVLPGAGMAFVWTLASEIQSPNEPGRVDPQEAVQDAA